MRRAVQRYLRRPSRTLREVITHIASGLCLLVLPVVAARVGNWRSVRRDFREAQFWDEDDRRFFSAWLSDEEPPVGRFNAGRTRVPE